jgi:hypothetical protein
LALAVRFGFGSRVGPRRLASLERSGLRFSPAGFDFATTGLMTIAQHLAMTMRPTMLDPASLTLTFLRSFDLPLFLSLHFTQSDLIKRLDLFVRLTMRLPHSRQTTFGVFTPQ